MFFVWMKNDLLRAQIADFPRKKRVAIGVICLLLSFVFAGIAVICLPVKNGKLEENFLPLLVSTVLSASFVVAQTVGGMFIVSITAQKQSNEPETSENENRP